MSGQRRAGPDRTRGSRWRGLGARPSGSGRTLCHRPRSACRALAYGGQVDAMSGGRVELGLGTGWFERAHGLRHPFSMLASGSSGWRSSSPSSPACANAAGGAVLFRRPLLPARRQPRPPKPVQKPHPAVIVGGGGAKARPAGRPIRRQFNSAFRQCRTCRQFVRVRAACEAIGRTRTLTMSAAGGDLLWQGRCEVRRGLRPSAARSTKLKGQRRVWDAAEVIDSLEEYGRPAPSRIYLQCSTSRSGARPVARVGRASTRVFGEE